MSGESAKFLYQNPTSTKSLNSSFLPTSISKSTFKKLEKISAKVGVPIIWITGPTYSGKTTLAYFLTEVSKFRLFQMKHLSIGQTKRDFTKEYMIFLHKEITSTCNICPGYIIEDFPPKKSKFRKFEKKIGKPAVVIYIYNSLDATLGRALAFQPNSDLNDIRISYVKQVAFAKWLYRRYKKQKRVIKIFSQYPVQDMNSKILELLEINFNYQFKQASVTT